MPAETRGGRRAGAPGVALDASPVAPPKRALEYACHVRDVLLAVRERVLTTLVVDDPEVPPLYREERVTLAGYAAEDLAEAVGEIDVAAHPAIDVAAQLNVMSSRAIQLFAGTRERWPLAGDQLIVDLDLRVASLPAGSRLAVGTAVIEVSPEPHQGCAEFSARFGLDAPRAVNSAAGRALRLRGLDAKVGVEGVARPGDPVEVVPPG